MRKLGIALLAATVILLPLSALAQDAADPAAQALLKKAEKIAAELVAAETATAKADKELDLAATEEAKTAGQEALTKAEANEKAALNALKAVVSELSAAKVDAEKFQQMLIERGVVTADSMSVGAAAGAAKKWAEMAKDWVIEKGPGMAISALVFLLILLVFRWLGRLFGKVTDKALSRSRLKVSTLLREFFVGIVRKTFFVLGLIIALGYVGINMGPVLAGIGVVGFVVGFALQDTLGNFAAGIMILLYRPYDVGDVITTGAGTGKVQAMSLVSTTIHTPDNQKTIIPNSAIWGGTITNITAMPTRRVDLTIGVGYGDDLDKTAKVLTEVVTAHEKVHADPAPTIRVANLGDSSVDFVVRPWCNTSDYWDVYFDLHLQIKQRLDAEGISIPFPQRDVHIYQETGD